MWQLAWSFGSQYQAFEGPDPVGISKRTCGANDQWLMGL